MNPLEQSQALQSPTQTVRYAPRYRRALRDLLVAYILIITVVAGNLILHDIEANPVLRAIVMFPSGVLVAFLFHFLFLFLHEAGHFNLFPNRQVNDALGNLFVGYWFFQDISLYRRMHWKHHLRHGETDDPENFYFLPLTFGNLFKTISGILTYSKVIAWDKSQVREKGDTQDLAAKFRAICFFGIYNIGIFILFMAHSTFAAYAVVWLVPLFCGFPVFSFIRQECEHRRLGSGCQIFGKEAPGCFTGVFRPTLGAYFMGGAGFRQHWYHHFNPSISYTRLDDFAEEVRTTLPGLTSSVKETTYLRTFLDLMRDAYRPSNHLRKHSG